MGWEKGMRKWIAECYIRLKKGMGLPGGRSEIGRTCFLVFGERLSISVPKDEKSNRIFGCLIWNAW